MSGAVLILTQDFDPTVDPVVQSLNARGAEVVRVDLSYFPRQLTFTTSDFDGERRRLQHRGRDIDLDRCRACGTAARPPSTSTRP